MSFACPVCGERGVVYSRRAKQTSTTRYYRCPAKHTFATKEVNEDNLKSLVEKLRVLEIKHTSNQAQPAQAPAVLEIKHTSNQAQPAQAAAVTSQVTYPLLSGDGPPEYSEDEQPEELAMRN